MPVIWTIYFNNRMTIWILITNVGKCCWSSLLFYLSWDSLGGLLDNDCFGDWWFLKFYHILGAFSTHLWIIRKEPHPIFYLHCFNKILCKVNRMWWIDGYIFISSVIRYTYILNGMCVCVYISSCKFDKLHNCSSKNILHRYHNNAIYVNQYLIRIPSICTKPSLIKCQLLQT